MAFINVTVRQVDPVDPCDPVTDTQRYAAALEQALREAFPGVEVEVTPEPNVVGATRYAVEGVDEDEVRRIADRVWDHGDW